MKAWSVNDADTQGTGEGREEAKEQEKKKKHLLYLNFLWFVFHQYLLKWFKF